MSTRTDTEIVIAMLHAAIDAAKVAEGKADRHGLMFAAGLLQYAEHLAHSLIFPFEQAAPLPSAIEVVAIVAGNLAGELRDRAKQIKRAEQRAKANALLDPQ